MVVSAGVVTVVVSIDVAEVSAASVDVATTMLVATVVAVGRDRLQRREAV